RIRCTCGGGTTSSPPSRRPRSPSPSRPLPQPLESLLGVRKGLKREAPRTTASRCCWTGATCAPSSLGNRVARPDPGRRRPPSPSQSLTSPAEQPRRGEEDDETDDRAGDHHRQR